MDGDVTDPQLNERAVATALERFGRLGAVALNAGIAASGDLLDLALEVFDRAIEVNVRAVTIDLAAEAITVDAVCPGPIETGMTAGIRHVPAMHDGLRRAVPMQRWGQPGEIAAVIAFLLSPAAGFVTGAAIPAAAGSPPTPGSSCPRNAKERDERRRPRCRGL